MGKQTTREKIITAADVLFYERGVEHTSFADIAGVVKISRGNFYHHFKSKDDILSAVIKLRLANTSALLSKWKNDTSNPVKRIMSFIDILIANKTKIMRFGCPVGTLCSELAKLDHDAQHEASKLFKIFHSWLREQFVLLGRKNTADDLAMHILMRSQGVASLAQALRDDKFVEREVALMHKWLISNTQ